MRISYWSSDVCSSDLGAGFVTQNPHLEAVPLAETGHLGLLFLGRLDIVCQKEVGLCVGYGIIRRRHCREDRDREMGVMKACELACILQKLFVLIAGVDDRQYVLDRKSTRLNSSH